jgi:hypothetical protein
MALSLLVVKVVVLIHCLLIDGLPRPDLWDRSMLHTEQPAAWYANLWLWWSLLGAILVGIYWKFW